MTNKIFRSTVLVAVVVLLCSMGIVVGVLYSHFTGVQVQQFVFLVGQNDPFTVNGDGMFVGIQHQAFQLQQIGGS